MLYIVILLATVVHAAVVQVNRARDARPGRPAVRDLAVTSSAPTSSFASTTTEAAILRRQETATSATCIASSICFEGFTCGQRYGACYDKNFCDGNTSPYPIPTCPTVPAITTSTTIPTLTTSTITSTSTIGSTGDRVVANADAVEGALAAVMEEELGNGTADAVVGPGTGN